MWETQLDAWAPDVREDPSSHLAGAPVHVHNRFAVFAVLR